MNTEQLDAGLEAFTEEELGIRFSELAEISANQPDDEMAMRSLRAVVIEVRDQGRIDMAFQMAMTLGAMACLHPHMEGVANELGRSLDAFDDGAHEHGKREKTDTDTNHDKRTCADCRAGRRCPKKH